MAETLNMRESSVDEIIRFIKEDLIQMEIYDPVIVLGKMGMGKTASLKNLANELNIGYCELRLVNMTETDMLGIPTVSKEGTTTYASNDLLPIVERDGEVGILALDEITSCSSTMRAAAYQLLDGQRRLGNYKLPDKWICVGLGNGPDDGGVFNGAEAALFTRCYCFRVAPNLDSWKEWAIEAGINPAVIAYLSYDPTKLHVYNPDDEMDGICPTPRTWEKLSKLLNAKEKANGGNPLPISVAEFYAGISVGVKEAGSFSGFYQYTQNGKAVNIADVLSGKANGKEAAKAEPQVVYIAIENLIRAINDTIAHDAQIQTTLEPSDETIDKVCNVVRWITDLASVRLDYGITGIRDLISGSSKEFYAIICDDRFDDKCPEFLKFCSDNNVAVKAQ